VRGGGYGFTEDMCDFIHPDGRQCKTAPLKGERFCYFHHPGLAEERKRAQIAGGKAGSRKALSDAALVRLDSRDAIIDLLSETVQQVRTGQLDPKIANAVGYLCNVIRQLVEQEDIEKLAHEIAKLKAQLGLHGRIGLA
jgi:hypothetical protein